MKSASSIGDTLPASSASKLTVI